MASIGATLFKTDGVVFRRLFHSANKKGLYKIWNHWLWAVDQELATLFTEVGHSVSIAVRDVIKNKPAIPSKCAVASMIETANAVDVLMIAFPFANVLEAITLLAGELKGKIVVDCTNPIYADWSPMLLGQANSGGEEIQRSLPESYVIKAFDTIFADVMERFSHNRDG